MLFKNEFEKEILQEVGLTMSQVKLRIQKELQDQGHVATGQLLRSIENVIEARPNLFRAMILMEDYGFAIDTGVPAANIPYSGNGGGGTSQYIQGLYSWWLLKGLSTDDALRAAFATAMKHKKEGMPTKASFFYSNNGRRTGFFTDTLEVLENEILGVASRIEGRGKVLIENLVREKVKVFGALTIQL